MWIDLRFGLCKFMGGDIWYIWVFVGYIVNGYKLDILIEVGCVLCWVVISLVKDVDVEVIYDYSVLFLEKYIYTRSDVVWKCLLVDF